MNLTVADLIELLADFPEDAEVRLATQPSWPLEHTVRPQLGYTEPVAAEHAGIVYLAEGAQVGYLSGDVAGEVFGR